MDWLLCRLLLRWILCKRQSLTTHLESPFPQRRDKWFPVVSASFALTRMWVSPFHCSLQSVGLEADCSEHVHLFIHTTYSPEAHLLGAVAGPFISVCQLLKGFRFTIRNLSPRVANIKNQGFLYVISLICIIVYLILPLIFTFQKCIWIAENIFLKFKMQWKYETNAMNVEENHSYYSW